MSLIENLQQNPFSKTAQDLVILDFSYSYFLDSEFIWDTDENIHRENESCSFGHSQHDNPCLPGNFYDNTRQPVFTWTVFI